jgi:hypothetical protein
VYLRADHRRNNFRLTRTTLRAPDFLHRFRLVDRAPAPGRNFRTGNVGDFKRRWANREVMPALFTLNDEALRRPALDAIHEVLTAPTGEDLMRRERGQQFVEETRRMTLDLDTDPFAPPSSLLH